MKIYLFQSIWAHNSHEILVSRCTILAAVSCYWYGQYYTQYQFIRAIQYLWCVALYYEAWNINNRVCTLFGTKTPRTFKDTFRIFKDSIQCKKEPWVYVCFSSTPTWAILSWRSFILGTWESGLDKVSTEIQGLSSTDCNFQGLSRPWTYHFKFQGLSRTFKVRANPVTTTVCCIQKYNPENKLLESVTSNVTSSTTSSSSSSSSSCCLRRFPFFCDLALKVSIKSCVTAFVYPWQQNGIWH